MEWGIFGDKALNFILKPVKEDSRLNILEGSVRSGKTICMIPKWLNYIAEGPKGLLVMTGVSKDTIYDNVLRDLFDTVGDKNYSFNRQTGDLRIYNRDIKVIGAKDEGSEKYLRGKTLAGAYCDELSLMPERFFKQLLNRLSVKGSKLYGTTNPDSPYHYLNVEYITDKKKIEKGMVNIIHFDLEDNPNLDDEYLDFIRNAYTGLWYDRMIKGLWVLADGVIYSEFDDKRHCISKDDLPDNFDKLYVGCDYGITNPHVYLMCGFKNIDGVVHAYIFKEYYNKGEANKVKTDLLFVKDYKDFISNYDIKSLIIDPSATSLINLMRQNGVKVKEANNEVIPGINNVSNWLKQDRIHIVKKMCPNLVKEFASYVWDEKAQKRGEDKPIKTNDHCLTGDTIVNTTKGDIPIKDLVGKEGQVYCYDETNRASTISDFIDVRLTQKQVEVYEIELEDGRTIKATAEHPILTKNGWKLLKDLTEYDYIIDIGDHM